mmetsp:Transcript_1163/g.1703  ORF Transcript_1163/g.1703 Transcript_1163/m.1703 type:complete len:201 (+) Transcript_1163:1386-1988(+)
MFVFLSVRKYALTSRLVWGRGTFLPFSPRLDITCRFRGPTPSLLSTTNTIFTPSCTTMVAATVSIIMVMAVVVSATVVVVTVVVVMQIVSTSPTLLVRRVFIRDSAIATTKVAGLVNRQSKPLLCLLRQWYLLLRLLKLSLLMSLPLLLSLKRLVPLRLRLSPPLPLLIDPLRSRSALSATSSTCKSRIFSIQPSLPSIL